MDACPSKTYCKYANKYCVIQLQFFFLFQNYLKDLHLSYKMDLDFWDRFGKEKPCLIIKEILYGYNNDL